MMNEEKAREILASVELELGALNSGSLNHRGTRDEYISWSGDEKVMLDGKFTADDLEAIAWWMRNMGPSDDS